MLRATYSSGWRARSSAGFFQRHSVGHVAVQRIVRAGLIGEDVGDDAAARHLGKDVGAIAHQADGDGFRPGEHLQRFVERAGHAVAVAGLDAALYARGIHLDAEEARAVHGRGQRLRAAHSAHAAGNHELAGQRSAEVLAGE